MPTLREREMLGWIAPWLFGTALAAGCVDAAGPETKDPETLADEVLSAATTAAEVLLQPPRGIESEFLRIERAVPGFGGFYPLSNLAFSALAVDRRRAA